MTNDVLDQQERLAKVVAAYQGLSRESLPALMAMYGEQANFKDPFNEVCGRESIERIFLHMFSALEGPRFVVTLNISQGNDAFLTWEFHFRRRAGRTAFLIRGATQLHFSENGCIDLHRDYWDAAEELYSKLPVLGSVMRWLRRSLATPQKK